MVKVELKANTDLGRFVVIERRRDLDDSEKEARRCSRCHEIHNDDVTRLVLTETEAKELHSLLSLLR